MCILLRLLVSYVAQGFWLRTFSVGRNEQRRSGTTQIFFSVQLSFTISASVAVIFRKKELHDNEHAADRIIIRAPYRDDVCL